MRMTSASLTIVGRSSAGQPRTFRRTRAHYNRDAAYRRLVGVILGLDVPTLAAELRGKRLADQVPQAA
jgi:hypothetical protein